jgi:hypothetical protein
MAYMKDKIAVVASNEDIRHLLLAELAPGTNV